MIARQGVLALVVVCAGVPGALACTNEEPMSLEDAFVAVTYAATLTHVEGVLGTSLAFVALGAGEGVDAGALAIEADLRNSRCVSVLRSANVLDLRWKGCAFHGWYLTGHQIVTVTRADPDAVEVHSEWYGFYDSHVGLSGTADVRWKPEAGLSLTYDLAWSTPNFAATSKGDQKLAIVDDAGVFTVTVAGSDLADSNFGHFEVVASDMRVGARAPIAETGTLALTSPSGRHATLRLTPLDATHVRLDFDGLEHPFAIILSPKTEKPLDR